MKGAFLFLIFILSFSIWARPIKVMSYNVENLFDTVHDPGKEDWTFLPLKHPQKVKGCHEIAVEHYKKECLETDWTPDKLDIKLTQITKVIMSGGTPDILALMEVENQRVVALLQKKLGYKAMLITNSPDRRGIDVALLFNPSVDLKFVNSTEHRLQTSQFGIRTPTRNILEANFTLKGKPFSLYVNHWPSQQSGPGARNSAAQQLLKVLSRKLSDKNTRVMLVGDFNVTDSERPNPMEDVLLKNTGLVDVYKLLSRSDLSSKRLPPGTYFYGWDFTWHRLDRIIVSQNFLKEKPLVSPKTFNVYAPNFIQRLYEQRNPDRPHAGKKMIVPWSYWHNAYTSSRAGFSDHYAVQVLIDP